MRVDRIAEWTALELPGYSLSAEDRRRLGYLPGAAFAVDELRSGLRLRAGAMVGVVQLDHVRIEIVPKLAGGAVRVGQMLQCTLGLVHLEQFDFAADVTADGRSLVDVIIALLVARCEDVLRRGLESEPREHEELLPFVRGRFLADRQVLRRFGRLDRLYCRFDERTTDTRDNRLLLGALRAGLRLAADPTVRANARRLCAILDDRCGPLRVDDRVARPYHRLNNHYRPAHTLAQLVLDAVGFDRMFDRGSIEGYSFLLDMNRLFESFVERLIGHAVGKLGKVRAQARDGSILVRADTGKPYATVIPDLLVEFADGERLPVDAKYKRYDQRKLARDDVDQAFLYAYAYASEVEAPLAMLVHPTEADVVTFLPLEVRSKAGRPPGRLRVIGVPIGVCLDELAAGGGPNLTALAHHTAPSRAPQAPGMPATANSQPWFAAHPEMGGTP